MPRLHFLLSINDVTREEISRPITENNLNTAFIMTLGHFRLVLEL